MTILSAENMALAGASGYSPAPIWRQQAAGGATYNSLRWQGYPLFLTEDQMARLERVGQGKDLFDGRHREYYLNSGRTSFDFPFVNANGIKQRMYVTYNLLGLITVKSAGLLFGQSPLFNSDDPDQGEWVKIFAQRSNLHARLLNSSMTASYAGDAMLELVRHTDGEVYVLPLPPDSIFPLGQMNPSGGYDSYWRPQLKNLNPAPANNPSTSEAYGASGGKDAKWILLETTVAVGVITRRCFLLGRDWSRKQELDVKTFDPTLTPETATGLDVSTIVYVPNLLESACSDYDGALDLQDSVNAKNTQVARVLMKHSDPKLAAPRNMADQQGNITQAAEVYFFDDPQQKPAYITWSSEIQAAIADRDAAVRQLLIKTETSPALLGLKEGAAPDSYRKMRLELTNSLDKAARKAITWTKAVQDIIATAIALENAAPGRLVSTDPVGVTLRDGIPVDDVDQATTIATLRTAGVLSRKRAVAMQLPDQEAVESELAELERESQSNAPTVMGGVAPGGQVQEPGEVQGPGSRIQSQETETGDEAQEGRMGT